MELRLTFLAERYERRSVLIASNLVFSKWDQIFLDPMTTMAAIDRLVHHATILEFPNRSVRAHKPHERSDGPIRRASNPHKILSIEETMNE